MANTRTTSKRTAAKKTVARKTRPATKQAGAAKKSAARKARPVAKKATAVKKAAVRKARPAVKKARAAKKTAVRKARPVAKKATAAKQRATKAVKRAPATKAAKRVVKKAAPAKKRVSAATTRPAARTGTGSPVDAIALLKQDHREVNQLFTEFERAGKGANRTKRRLVDQMIQALSVHAGIEELVFYPAVRREVAGSNADVLEAIEEHHVVKLLLHELESLVPDDERFAPKVTVLIENVRHHVKEEENELFPEVQKRLGKQRLLDIGAELRDARGKVPPLPHPYAPDAPPGNAIVGGAVIAIDRARIAGKKVVERVRDELPSR